MPPPIRPPASLFFILTVTRREGGKTQNLPSEGLRFTGSAARARVPPISRVRHLHTLRQPRHRRRTFLARGDPAPPAPYPARGPRAPPRGPRAPPSEPRLPPASVGGPAHSARPGRAGPLASIFLTVPTAPDRLLSPDGEPRPRRSSRPPARGEGAPPQPAEPQTSDERRKEPRPRTPFTPEVPAGSLTRMYSGVAAASAGGGAARRMRGWAEPPARGRHGVPHRAAVAAEPAH